MSGERLKYVIERCLESPNPCLSHEEAICVKSSFVSFPSVFSRALLRGGGNLVARVCNRTQPDVDSVLASLDIVRYSLGCSIFLGMTMEKAAFAQQLPKFW